MSPDEVEEHVRAQIRYWVWGGYHDADEVAWMIEDVIEDGVDLGAMRAFANAEFVRKADDELGWPALTDSNRLDAAFAKLDAAGVCAVQNAGYTMSDGFADVAEALEDRGRGNYHGYCFFHGQDLERAIDGHGLSIAFGDVRDDKGRTARVGRMICDALTEAGLTAIWDGDVERRIDVRPLEWKRRL